MSFDQLPKLNDWYNRCKVGLAVQIRADIIEAIETFRKISLNIQLINDHDFSRRPFPVSLKTKKVLKF